MCKTEILLFPVTLDYLKIIWRSCLLIKLDLVDFFLFDPNATASSSAEG